MFRDALEMEGVRWGKVSMEQQGEGLSSYSSGTNEVGQGDWINVTLNVTETCVTPVK